MCWGSQAPRPVQTRQWPLLSLQCAHCCAAAARHPHSMLTPLCTVPHKCCAVQMVIEIALDKRRKDLVLFQETLDKTQICPQVCEISRDKSASAVNTHAGSGKSRSTALQVSRHNQCMHTIWAKHCPPPTTPSRSWVSTRLNSSSDGRDTKGPNQETHLK